MVLQAKTLASTNSDAQTLQEGNVTASSMLKNCVEQKGGSEGTFPTRPNPLRWYAIHVSEGAEDTTAQKCRKLIDKSLLEDCFVPKCEKYFKRQGSWQLITLPLFGEYFFVATRNVRALSQELAKLSVATSFAGRNGLDVNPLSSEVQTWFESVLDGGYVLRASEGVIEGGALRVVRGPLCGQEGKVRKINRHKRLAYVGLEEGSNAFLLRAALNVPEKK